MQNVPVDIGNSNRIYSSDEEAHISSFFSPEVAQQKQLCSRIADLERQKQDIVAQIQILQDEEESISTRIYPYRIALAPHKRLSNDLLNEIFTWCVLDDPTVCVPWHDPISSDCGYYPDRDPADWEGWEDSWDNSGADDTTTTNEDVDYSDWSAWLFDEEPMKSLPVPLILSRICSAWRYAALSMPLLWSNVLISSFTRRTKRLATEWLSRARDCPVSITIYEFAEDSMEFNLFPELKGFLLQYHFKTLELPFWSGSCILSELPAERTAQLERLCLVDVDKYQQSSVLLKGNPWCPHLRELELVGNFQFGDRTFTLPWTSLHNLYIELCSLPAADCFDILRQCTSLQTCSLGVSGVTKSIEGQSIHLPTLRDLSITFFFSQAHIGTFFRPLTIPCLTALAVRGTSLYDPSSWSDHDFSEMIRRSNCSLTNLMIEFYVEPIDLLTIVPELRLLLLEKVIFDQDSLDRLAHGELGQYLQHFTVYDGDSRKLWEMNERRQENSEQNDAVTPFITFSVPRCLPDN